MTVEWSVAGEEGRFLGSADDKVEIAAPIGSQTEGGHVVDVLRVRSADQIRHLAPLQRRQPALQRRTAPHQVQLGLGPHLRIIAARVRPQILPKGFINLIFP